MILKELLFPRFFVGVSTLLLFRKLRHHYSDVVVKSFTDGVPALQFRPPELLQRKGRLVPRIDAEQIVQFTQRCRIQFGTKATGPQVPWTIFCTLIFVECSLNPALLARNIPHSIALSEHSGHSSREL